MNNGGYLVPKYLYEPINSWQRFKQNHFPSWLLKMFPVKFNKIPIKALFTEAIKKENEK